MRIELFSMEEQHCELVAKISKECLQEYWSLEGFRDVLRYDNNIYYVAKDMESETVVGFAGIMLVADEAELLNIAVSEHYRQQGIAQRLLNRLLREAENRNAYRILLEVRQSNEIAKQFYYKNHFCALGERKDYYSNPKENAIIMERIFKMDMNNYYH